MTSNFTPPYISAGELAKFINSLRTRKPDPLTLKSLLEIGVSKSNSYTLKGSLVGFGLYDDEGKLLEREDLVGLSSKDESIKQETFKKILSRTYKELMEAVSVDEATVEKVRHYFEVNGAASVPALKGARLFIWLADQAGYKTAEDSFTPYKIDQDKTTTKQTKITPKKPSKQNNENNLGHKKSDKPKSYTYKQVTADDYEERLLNILLDKITLSDGLPDAEILKQVRELIDSKKSRHADNVPEPSARKENEDA